MDETAPIDGSDYSDDSVVEELPLDESAEDYPAEEDPVDDYPVEDVWLDYEVIEGDPGDVPADGEVAIEIWPEPLPEELPGEEVPGEELPPEEWDVEILYLEDGDPGAEGGGEDVAYEDPVYEEPIGDPGVIIDDGPLEYEELMSETGRPGDVLSDDELIFYTTANPEIYYTAVQRDVVPEAAFGADRDPVDLGFTSHDIRSAGGEAHFHMV